LGFTGPVEQEYLLNLDERNSAPIRGVIVNNHAARGIRFCVTAEHPDQFIRRYTPSFQNWLASLHPGPMDQIVSGEAEFLICQSQDVTLIS